MGWRVISNARCGSKGTEVRFVRAQSIVLSQVGVGPRRGDRRELVLLRDALTLTFANAVHGGCWMKTLRAWLNLSLQS